MLLPVNDHVEQLCIRVTDDLHPALVPLLREDFDVEGDEGRDAFSPDCDLQGRRHSVPGCPFVEVNCDCHILQFARNLARVSGRKWPKMDINGQ